MEALERWRKVSRAPADAPIFGITTRRIRQVFARYKALVGIPAPITVHSLFNAANFGLLFLQQQIRG